MGKWSRQEIVHAEIAINRNGQFRKGYADGRKEGLLINAVKEGSEQCPITYLPTQVTYYENVLQVLNRIDLHYTARWMPMDF